MASVPKYLRSEAIAFVHSRAALMLWSVCFVIYPSAAVVRELGYTLLYVCCVFGIAGNLVALYGLRRAYRADSVKTKYEGYLIELIGLLLAVSAPAMYCIVQVYLLVSTDDKQQIQRAAFSYALCASLLTRIVMVRRYLKAGK